MKDNDRLQAHTADFLFTLGLFSLFAAAAFLLVMIDIHVYKSTVESMQDTYTTRTAISYVAEKLRRHDAGGAVSLGEVEGLPALIFSDDMAGSTYLTYIYADSETLYELTVREGTAVTAAMGEEILRVKDFTVTDAGNGFFAFSASDSRGDPVRYLTHPRSTGPVKKEVPCDP